MNQLSRRLFSLRNISILKRSFGGHAPKGKEPFPTFEWKKETPQEGRYYTNEDEATFCSQKPGDTLEGWEPIAAIGVVIMIYFSYDFFTAPDNSLESWAHKEALARIAAKENGEEVKYGEFRVPYKE